MIPKATGKGSSLGKEQTRANQVETDCALHTIVFTGTPPSTSRARTIRSISGIICFVALLAIITGLLYFLRFQDHYQRDSQSYIQPAVNVVAGHGFTDSAGAPETNRTPGYPLLLVPFLWGRVDLRDLVILQHLLRIALVLAATAFTFQVAGRPRQALLAGLLLCLDFPMLESANLLLTELSFTIILSAALYLLWTMPRKAGIAVYTSIAAGFLAGASVLIRPVSIFFFLPAVVYLLLTSKRFRLRAIISFVLAFSVFPCVWAARNYRVTGEFTVSTISGYSMLQYRAAGVMAINDPGAFMTNLEIRRDELEALACQQLQQLYGRGCSRMTVAEKSKYYWELGRKIVLQHPVPYLKVALRGAVLMMLDGGTYTLEGITGIKPHLGLRILMFYTVPLFCFGILGLWECWHRDRNLFWLAALVVPYFIVISAGAETYSRFRVPIIPLYAVLIAIGLDSVLNGFARSEATA